MEQTASKDKIVDHALLLRRGDRILPSKRRRNVEEIMAPVKGAIVLLPEAGMHNGIGIFDAASLYPSIIREFNISPETKSNTGSISIKSPEGDVYKFLSADEKKGLLPTSIEEFMKLREVYREQKKEAAVKYGHDSIECKNLEETETAVKFITTSFYGVNAFKNFRLFDPECANAITAVGRIIIKAMQKGLAEKGFPVVYGDTDSTFVNIRDVENGDEVSKYIKEIIDKVLSDMGVRGDGINVKFEKYFKWIVFKRNKIRKGVYEAVKKKYIGYCTFSEGKDGKMQKDDYLYIRGFETRRSDANVFMKKCMEEFFELLKPGDIKASLTYLYTIKEKFYKLGWRELTWPRKVHDMEANNPWVRGMKYGQEVLGWRYDEDTAPELLYIKEVPMDKKFTKEICVQSNLELPEGFKVDYDIMFEKIIKKKFDPILDSLGMDWEGKKQSSLDDWSA